MLTPRDRYLQRKYNITQAEYDKILAAQGGGCAICGDPPPASGRSLAVDHCHKTGAVRGICCWACNKFVLGGRGDRIDIHTNAAEYLRSYPATEVLGEERAVPDEHRKPKRRRRK